jgi:porphobilinogen deaminase
VENMYGTYLGKHGDVYVVAVTKRKDMDDFFFCEEFESLDELKEEWMIRL